MSSQYILLLGFILLSSVLWAQRDGNSQRNGKKPKGSGTIYGNVISDGEALSYASVSLFKMRDSSLVNGIISDEKGRFELKEVPYGNYYLSISFIGFEKKVIELTGL